MRCENKPLLQDDPGFLQEITPIAVEVGLADCFFKYCKELLFQVAKTRLHDTMIFWKQIVRMSFQKCLSAKDLAPRARFELEPFG